MNVLELRLRLGLNCREFARLVGCSVSTLNSWERRGIEPDGALLTILESIDKASRHDVAVGFLKACAKDGRGLADVLEDLFLFWCADREVAADA